METIEQRLRRKLEARFSPTYLELENESHNHNVSKGSETHFRALIVSHVFADVDRLSRSRLVHETVSEELKGGVHAFTHRTYTPEEWAKATPPPQSPLCAKK